MYDSKKRWRDKNKERIKEYNKKYYQKNKKKRQNQRIEYYHNVEKIKMKTEIKYKKSKAKLLGPCIFVSGEENGFYEYDSEEYAKKVWEEILENWRKSNYQNPMGLWHTVDCVAEDRKHSKHLVAWP